MAPDLGVNAARVSAHWSFYSHHCLNDVLDLPMQLWLLPVRLYQLQGLVIVSTIDFIDSLQLLLGFQE